MVYTPYMAAGCAMAVAGFCLHSQCKLRASQTKVSYLLPTHANLQCTGRLHGGVTEADAGHAAPPRDGRVYLYSIWRRPPAGRRVLWSSMMWRLGRSSLALRGASRPRGWHPGGACRCRIGSRLRQHR